MCVLFYSGPTAEFAILKLYYNKNFINNINVLQKWAVEKKL